MDARQETSLNTSLSSLALLSLHMSEGKDYLDYLHGFVIEVLHGVNAEGFDAATVQQMIKDEFGLAIPVATLAIYLKRLQKKGVVRRTPDGHQFQVIGLPAVSMADDRKAARSRIDEVRRELRSYALSQCARNWTDDEAVAVLADFLRKYSIEFVRHSEFRSPLPDAGADVASAHFIVASFIRHCADSAQGLFDSVTTLVESHILANALLCPDLKNVTAGLGNIVFVLDTRLLLHALDIEAPIDTENTRRLLESVRRLKGVLCVFPITVAEIRSVLNGIKRGFTHGNARGRAVEELRKRGRGPADVILTESHLEEKLKDLHVSILPCPQYDDEKTYRFQIDETALREELEDELGYTLGKAAEHDVRAVRSIYALRKGRRVSRLENAGYVFVTTNAALSRAAFNQLRAEKDGWVFSAVVTAFHLSHLVWLKSPMEAGDLARTELLSSCYAAMHPPQSFWRSYLQEVDRLKAEGRFSERDHEVLRLSLNAPEELMLVTQGEIDGITEANLRTILQRLEHTYAEEKASEIRRLQLEQERISEDLASAQHAARKAEVASSQAAAREEALEQETIAQAHRLRQLEENETLMRDREARQKARIERIAERIATATFVAASLLFAILGFVSLFGYSNVLFAVPFGILALLNLVFGFTCIVVKRCVRSWIASCLSRVLESE